MFLNINKMETSKNLSEFQKRLLSLNNKKVILTQNVSLYKENVSNSLARRKVRDFFNSIINTKDIESKKNLSEYINEQLKITLKDVILENVTLDSFLNKKSSKVYSEELEIIKLLLK